MRRYERIQKPWLIPTSLPERPSKIAPDTPVVRRKPNQTKSPTIRPPAIPLGSPATLASLAYRIRSPSTNDAMNAPTNPAANPLGAPLPHRVHVRLGLPERGHPRLPEGGTVPNSPDDKAHDRRHNHADKEVRIEHDRHAVRLLGPVDTSPSANMAFPGPDEDPRRPVQPGSGTDLGDGLARRVGAGAPPALFLSGLGGFSKSRMTGVKGSTRPPAQPRSPSRRTSASWRTPPT